MSLAAAGDVVLPIEAPHALAEREETTVDVLFAPLASGVQMGRIVIRDGRGENLEVAAQGLGAVPCSDVLSCDRTALVFGDVMVGTTSELQVTCTHSSGGTASYAATPQLSQDYALTSFPVDTSSVAAGAPVQYRVSFTPQNEGVAAGSLTVSVAECSQALAVSGSGVPCQEYGPCATRMGEGGSAALPAPPQGGALAQNPDGSITLYPETRQGHYAWVLHGVVDVSFQDPAAAGDYLVDNPDRGTLAKVDIAERREVGRYVALLRIGGQPALPDWDQGCFRSQSTTVDQFGSLYVTNVPRYVPPNNALACPNEPAQGFVTKIAHYDAAICETDLSLCQCQDRNGNGAIETSKIVLWGEPDLLGYEDECLLWTALLPAIPSAPGAIAVDALGNLWVADGLRYYKMNPADGAILDARAGGLCMSADPVTDCTLAVALSPLTAEVSAQGVLWFSGWVWDASAGWVGRLQGIDTLTGVVGPVIQAGSLSGLRLAIDDRERVWVRFNQWARPSLMLRFDPQLYDPADPQAAWSSFSLDPWIRNGSECCTGNVMEGKGVVVAPDGNVWTVYNGEPDESGIGIAWLLELDIDTGAVLRMIDFAGTASICGRWDWPGGVNIPGRRLGLDLGSGGELLITNVWGNTLCIYDPRVDSFFPVEVGRGMDAYSHFSGQRMLSRAAVYSVIFDACEPGATSFAWSAVQSQAAVPPGAELRLYARAADTQQDLATAAVHGPNTPGSSSLALPGGVLGSLLQVDVLFIAAANAAAPTLEALEALGEAAPRCQ
ncbi:MAG: hypothetical protein HYZ27_05695 [Deltaproteobacteria bacterium]|nr:hypothetical protein [Deltaproteobacteria bacterium]